MSSKKYNASQGWTEALIVAKSKLAEGRSFVGKMKAAIKTIEQKIAAGEPWPGKSATRN